MGTCCRIAGLVLAGLLAGEARAEQVAISPVAAGQYYAGYREYRSGNIFKEASPPTMAPATNSASLSFSFELVSPMRAMMRGCVLEYSLAALPAGAVVTGATVTYQLTSIKNGVRFDNKGNGTSVPPILLLSMFDGGDGVVTLADMLKPDVEVGAHWEPVAGLNTFTLADLSGFNVRTSEYVGFSLMDMGYHDSGAVLALGPAGPALTLEYVMAPEPASAGVLGAGVLLLLRRGRMKRNASGAQG